MPDPELEKEIRSESSMTYWWPIIRDLDIPTPQTIRVECERAEVEDSSDAEGGFTVMRPRDGNILDAIYEVDGPPAFFRSDQMSAKHRMNEGSKISSNKPNDFAKNLWTVIERNSMAIGVPDPKCYYVREWLDLYHEYTAFGGTPIAAELRFFVHDGDVHGSGFYWPTDAIRNPSEDDWETRHEAVKETALCHQEGARELAGIVAEEFDGYWSVDFALTDEMEWVCIDMTRGEASWHPEGVERPEAVTDGT